MKYIISERQYNIFKEQSEFMMDRRLGIEDKNVKALYGTVTNANRKEYLAKVSSYPWSHELATAMSIGASFIPIVGPVIAGVIGVADALQYAKEGDNKTAGMMAMFALMPGAAKVITKIPGVKQLGQKGMIALGSKLASKTPQLSSVEQQVVKGISQNSNLVKQEVQQIVANKAAQALKNPSLSAKIKPVLTSLAKGGAKLGGTLGVYAAAGAGYSAGYDYLNPQSQQFDLKTLDLKSPVSDQAKKTAAEIQWK